MQYVHYEEEIVLKRGVKLVGWTYDNIANPSTLSSAVQPLRNLRDAIKQGQCHFVRLSPQEVNKLKAAYQEKVRQGQVVPRQRKPRKDKGVRRRKAMDTAASLEEDEATDDDGPRLQKRRRISDDNIEDSDELIGDD
jgi:hypothetical protein